MGPVAPVFATGPCAMTTPHSFKCVATSASGVAQVDGARPGVEGLGLELAAGHVQVEFLPPEGKGRAPAREGLALHAQHAPVEVAGALQVEDREHDVVDAIDGDHCLAVTRGRPIRAPRPYYYENRGRRPQCTPTPP